jgi:hypothetical protein
VVRRQDKGDGVRTHGRNQRLASGFASVALQVTVVHRDGDDLTSGEQVSERIAHGKDARDSAGDRVSEQHTDRM